MLVRSAYQADEVDPKSYILYSKDTNNPLKYAPVQQVKQNEALGVRNSIIAIEQQLCDLHLNSLDNFTLIDELSPAHYPQFRGYIQRDLVAFNKKIQDLSRLERHYFLSFVSFIAREQRLAKKGVQGNDRLNGLAGLWLNTKTEKEDNFDILIDLKMTVNNSRDESPILQFKRNNPDNALANFRKGDIIILYPMLKNTDNALSNQVFKCSIIDITKDQVSVKLRSKQLNDQLFNLDIYWQIERDMLDSGFNQQYRSLYGFLECKTRYKSLIFGTEAPTQVIKEEHELANPNLSTEQKHILNKALSAKDYFLLVGPPGTGKTKFMLAELARHALEQTDNNIMLLAYTNRAVDEICDAIHDFAENDYIRVGSSYGTSPEFQHRLFNTLTEKVSSRKALKEVIQKHRIFVGTVSSMLGRMDLFNLKRFESVIIDESSQLLEPSLIQLLAKFPKFILIGDHKQLPAVVMQSREDSATSSELLQEIGLENLRNSLFERLFKQAQKEDGNGPMIN